MSSGNTVGYVGNFANLGINRHLLKKEFPDFIGSTDVAELSSIGIGVAFRPPGDGTLYKPGIKLANYWAHGIAPVCSYDASYVEMNGRSEGCVFVSTEKELLEACRELRDNDNYRRKIAKVGLDLSRKYTIEVVAEQYERIAEEV